MTAALIVEPAAVEVVRRARAARRRRTLTVSLTLGGVLAVLVGAALMLGEFPLTAGQVLASLTGRGSRAADFVVYDLRLPRVVTALTVGVCFGLSGAIFQSMLRNPLASPDIIGITAGASASAVAAILVFGLGGLAVSAAAFAGALATAAAMYLLAWRHGVAGYRLILVGVGIAAVMTAVIDYLMTRARIWDAQVALQWLTGSLNGASAETMRTVLILAALAVPPALWAGRALTGLQLGDDTARGIGLAVPRARLTLIVAAVPLAAIATAAAGPVAFVAFVSGPIARRLAGGAALVPAALVGAAVVAGADLAGQHLLGMSLPVGVLTAAVGAPYLLYLLTVSNRMGRGG